MGKPFHVALIAATALVSTAARADVHWYVSGTFDDGATITGTFDINQYGYIANPNLTTADGIFTGMNYTPATTSTGNTATSLTFDFNAYRDEMQLYFASDLNVGTVSNALLTTSKECRGNYCGSGGLTRHIISGFASINPISGIPEPTTWVLMIAGFGLTGAAMRRTKVRAVSYAA
ncbi:PEPxxWA-CTERM sorting domain-containing protein [Sphingomonas sp. MMS24-J13]|uniref:PEPxxWA-CTERM sorting domain-containing protein n=1 Tax=Sphingomonas sp. MMS24-J13 TaxID=3238686 RepID=UPI00384FD445